MTKRKTIYPAPQFPDDVSFKANVAYNCTRIRLRYGMSRKTAAAYLGLSPNRLSDIERGIIAPTVGTLQRYVDRFAVRPMELTLPVPSALPDEPRKRALAAPQWEAVKSQERDLEHQTQETPKDKPTDRSARALRSVKR